MFRAPSSPMDDAVGKATDENLTSENWEYILDVCDRVSASPSGPAQATAALIKRLAHRNANVQLYTLELAHALSQNCGLPLHRELASRAFTDALLRLAADRSTHAQVKQKVVERMATWSEDFRSAPELGIMEQAYHKLKMQHPALLPPPSKPVKREISSEDRRKEEEELQMALALSIKDKGPGVDVSSDNNISTARTTARSGAEHQPGQQQSRTHVHSQAQQGTTAATVSRVRALFDFTPSEPGELAFRKNDIIAVLESVYKDWWKGSLRGQTGIFPLNYVEKLQDPTKEELERDAQMEAAVFGEIKNVEKLLALLSVGTEGGVRRGERDDDEITELYQRTLSIRPKLVELIARYSQKKDDFTQLNEKFIKARRDYEALLESSMASSPYQQQQQQQQYPVRQQAPHPPQASSYGATPSAAAHGYLHHPVPPQQDTRRYYSPAFAEHSQPPPPTGFTTHNLPANDIAPTAPAPFHFIPGGVPPSQPNEGRRRPSGASPSLSQAGESFAGFHGQVRPNSIHTLNSGNPQELATGGYESPVDNRHSYPPALQAQQQQSTAQSHEPPAGPPFHVSAAGAEGQQQQQLRQTLSHPTGPPPAVPTSPASQQEDTGPYQAYQPYHQPGLYPQARLPQSGAQGEPGDFYR